MPNKDRTIKTLRLLGTKDLVLFSLQTLRMSQESSFQKYLHTAGGSLSTVSFPGLFCLVEWQLQFFFGDAVCCVHLWSKSSSPKISRALVFLFSCSFINKRTASNYQFSFFFFGETVCCVHLFSRKVINQVEQCKNTENFNTYIFYASPSKQRAIKYTQDHF